jgi:hypothetical protein
MWLSIGTSNELFEIFIKCGACLGYLKNCWFPKKDCAAWSQSLFIYLGTSGYKEKH